MTGDREFLLSARAPDRRHHRLALAVVAGLLLGLLLAAPFAGAPLAGTEALLPAYAAVVLLVDLIAATLLLAQFAVLGAVPLLVLAVGEELGRLADELAVERLATARSCTRCAARVCACCASQVVASDASAPIAKPASADTADR